MDKALRDLCQEKKYSIDSELQQKLAEWGVRSLEDLNYFQTHPDSVIAFKEQLTYNRPLTRLMFLISRPITVCYPTSVFEGVVWTDIAEWITHFR